MKKLGYVLALAALVAFFAAPASAQAHEDNFWVELDGGGILNPINSGGTGFPYPGEPGEDGLGEWFFYPLTDWWNQWFYDDPYDPERVKKVIIEVVVERVDDGLPAFLTLALNYSTGLWSEVGNPEPEPRVPPIGPFLDLPEEESFIVREILFEGPIEPGQPPMVFKWVIEDYNPEWVSIDVRGMNVRITEVAPGTIRHYCMDGIPAVSEWGLIVMLMLGLTAGTIMYRKFRATPA